MYNYIFSTLLTRRVITPPYPVVSAIIRAAGYANPSKATSVQFTVTFSKSVNGVDINDFILTTTGNISGASITGVTGTGATRTVTVNTGTGDGTLRLDLIDNDTILDLQSNRLGGVGVNNGNFDSGQSFVIDKTFPTVISILRSSPNPTVESSVDFAVTFSENVTGVDITDFTLTVSGVTGASVTSLSGSVSNYTVTVNTGTGSGTIRLDLTDNDSIRDLATNRLGGTGTANGNFTTGEIYNVRP